MMQREDNISPSEDDMFLKQGFWLTIGLLLFAAAHVCGASMLAATSGTQSNAASVFAHHGD
jgi:hypothetical protein